MTREEATEHLKTIEIYSFQDGYTDEAREALDMAIKALKQPEPCDVCENLEEGDTLYSRSEWDSGIPVWIRDIKFCPKCGRRLTND